MQRSSLRPRTGPAGASGSNGATLAPSDVRVANLMRVISELRGHGWLSRSDLARLTGLAVPTVHRLVSELVGLDLVIADEPVNDESRLGRPPSMYRFRQELGLLAGFDIGNQTTRFAVASLAGQVLASSSVPTADIEDDLVGGTVGLLQKLLADADASPRQLAGVGVGIAAAVDPRTGTLLRPPRYRQWQGVPLAQQLQERLGCEAVVDQDDHLAAVAECSRAGTVPDARSVVVLAIGKGIGVGFAQDETQMSGHGGRFGRIASWPVTPHRGARLPGQTLEECLTGDGLVAQYRLRGGEGPVADGLGLFAAARDGDALARTVVAWAGREIADVAYRLHTLFDPEALVLGGGLAGGFDLLERDLARHAPGTGALLRPSVLGEAAVLTGALLGAQRCVEPWLHARIVHG
jgi:predicted NBD/HSP70 family sugar kinase